MRHVIWGRRSTGSIAQAGLTAVMLVGLAARAQTLPAPPVSPVPVVNFEYDAEGNPTKTIVAPSTRALTNRHTYDSLARRNTTTDAKSGIVSFGYDLRDEPTWVKDPRQLTTSYNLDGFGNPWKLTSPDTGIANSTYDAVGNLKTRTDSRGVLATHWYDALNRIKQVTYSRSGSSNRDVKWTYDQTGTSFGAGVGRLTTAATPDATTTIRYDALGRVTATVQSVGSVGMSRSVTYDYDPAGNVTAITYPSGRVINFGRVNGQVRSIYKTPPVTPFIDQILMNAAGQPESWVWNFPGSPPRAHARVYDTNGRLVRHSLGQLVRDITYDDADRISRYTHYNAATAQPAPSYDQSFGYDELNRLTTVTGSTNWSYAYDANGNRTASTAGATARGLTVSSSSNRLDALTNPARSMVYNADGTTLSDIQSGSSANYTASYSLEGRLAAMAQGSTAGVEFGYDAMGRRVWRSQWTGSPTNLRTVTIYAYDLDNHLIGEYKPDGTPINEYIWLGDIPVVMINLSGAEFAAYGIHTDHLNTPRMLLEPGGALRWRWLGEPFGASPAEEQPTAGRPALKFNLRFPGQQYEAFGGRHYNHFRDYDPTTGRYVQSDPIGLEGGINTYAYSYSNPISYADPSGLQVPMFPPVPITAPTLIPGAKAAGGAGNANSGSNADGGLGGSEDRSRGNACTLYHIVDCQGETIYVGITQQDPRAREGQHSSRIDGKMRIYECVNCKLTFTPIKRYESRSSCENAETQQIQALRPFANDRKNPDGALVRYEKYREWFAQKCTPCQ
ncbi:RHS repeat domain-containing protein [Roseateles sp. DC23W]|uniref:RHS repeat domain-containing protein n=1 Tax=Pelomonas dachongensis TaxID=3299029 RepID=A0ABW7ERN0_9BURK